MNPTLTPFNPATDTPRNHEEALLVQAYNQANPSAYVQSRKPPVTAPVVPPVVPPPTVPVPPPTGTTIAQRYGVTNNPSDTAHDSYGNYYKDQAEQALPDEGTLYAEKLKQAQKEIDATNMVYADLLRKTQVVGQNRLGSSGARQARAGLLGSERGAAIDDQTTQLNMDQEQAVQAERLTKINEILGNAREGAAKELADKRAAKEAGYSKYIEYVSNADTRKQSKLTDLATRLLAGGIDVATLSDKELQDLASTYKVGSSDIVAAYKTAKAADDKVKMDQQKDTLGLSKAQVEIDKLKSDIAQGNAFNLSEGQARYTVDPKTGKAVLVASKGKTYAPKATTSGSGGVSGSGTTIVNGKPISANAQNILNILNSQGGTVDDYVKGTSKVAQDLRNEVYAGLSAQGGGTDRSNAIIAEGKSIVDDLLATKSYKDLGGYSSVLGGQLTTGYGDAKAKASQLSSILARDNLGLLKGAMSDKDVAFIQSMSSGFNGEGVQSEGYIQNRLEEIQKKLESRLKNAPARITQPGQPTGGTTAVDSTLSEFGL